LTLSAQIGTAVIQTAHIGALQVDTSNIAAGAISATYNTANSSGGARPVNATILSITVVVPAGDAKIILFYYANVNVFGLYDVHIRRNGSDIYSFSAFSYSRSQNFMDNPGSGTHVYSIMLNDSNGSGQVFDSEMTIMVANK
jgi:hypothetical protein